MFPLKQKKEPSTFSRQELAGGMDSSWGVIKRDLAYLKKGNNNKRSKNNSMKHVGNNINRLFSFSNLDFGHCISITEHLTRSDI